MMRAAPGWPGIPPRWTSSAKTGIGTSLRASSRVWFTISHGIINEVYYPSLDQACLRDLGLIVTDGQEFFSEEKRDARSTPEWVEPGVPAYCLANTCVLGRYRCGRMQSISSCADRCAMVVSSTHLQKPRGAM